MFKNKVDLSSTIGKVNSFIDELKQGIEKHLNDVKAINDSIDSLVENKVKLIDEVTQAKELIKKLGF